MTFAELRALIVSVGKDPLTVIDLRYDTPDVVVGAPLDHWVIRERDGVFDVGAEERGRFVTTRTFDTESGACDYLAGVVRSAGPVSQTAPERAHSKAVSADMDEQLNQMFPPASS